MRSRSNRYTASALALLAGTAVLLSACGAHTKATATARCTTHTMTAPATTPAASGSWPDPNANLANTRDAQDSAISSADVSRLAQAWVFKLSGTAAQGVGGSGSLAANPVV